MIFSEIFSVYYSTVAKILACAIEKPVTDSEMEKIIAENAFSESVLEIMPAIKSNRWQLINKDGSTAIKHSPSIPLTDMEKRWLKAVSMDKRIQLFGVEFPALEDVMPLFTEDDFVFFDSYSDGDSFTDSAYMENFRLIVQAIKEQFPLEIHTLNKNGNTVKLTVMPDYLEYSEKDDKFRLVGKGGTVPFTVNLGRIVSCSRYSGEYRPAAAGSHNRTKYVTIELTDERNALERVMLHFAHFEKQAEKTGDNTYRLTIRYDRDDETEILIRILGFGPFVKVTEPRRFVDLMVNRLKRQKKLNI